MRAVRSEVSVLCGRSKKVYGFFSISDYFFVERVVIMRALCSGVGIACGRSKSLWSSE